MSKIPCSIDGRPYVVDLRGMRIQTLDATRELVDQGTEPGEQTLAPNAAWKRTGEDFVLGAGQTWFDLVKESSRRRFRHSKGIDPWERREVRLHKSALGSLTSYDDARYYNTSWETSRMVVANGSLFVTVGTTLKQVTDPTAADWGTPTTVMTQGVSIVSAVSDGSRVWVASGGGNIGRWDAIAGTGNNSWSSHQAYLLLYANGRLIGAGDATSDAVLYELSATAKRTDIWTHPSANWTWDAATSAPNGIYIAGHQGDKSEIYLITNVDATGALNTPYHVMALPDGETVGSLCHYGGVMVIGTSRGIRLATIGGSGFLSHGPLLEMPDAVTCLEPQGEYVWFNYADPDDNNNTGLARLSLARFTSPLVPAWAPDLTGAVEGGWRTIAVTTWNDRRYFMMAKTGIGNGIRGYGEDDSDYTSSGYMKTGRITYGIPDPKLFSGLSAAFEPMPIGASLGVTLVEEDGTSVPLPTVGTTSDRLHRWELDITDEWVDLTFTLTRGSTITNSPVMHRWTLEGLPVPERTQEIYLPVILHGKVQHEGRPISQDPYTEFQVFQNLLKSRRPVLLRMGDWTRRVFVDGMLVGEGDGYVGVKDWTDDQRWIDATWLVKLVTLDR